MIKSIFKLIWKRKRRSTLMIVEMFISFLLLFALFAMVLKNTRSYLEPTGFDYENVWVVNMNIWGAGLSDEQNELIIDQLRRNILSMPDVLSLSNTSGNLPYSQSTYSTTMHYNDLKISTNRVQSDDAFAEVLGIKLKQGRWYNKTDEGNKEIPIVINQKLKEAMFGDENAIGEIVHSGVYKVVGVVEQFKLKGEYSEEPNNFFSRFEPNHFDRIFLLKVKPDAGIAFEEQLIQTASNIAKDWTIKVEPLSNYRKDAFQRTWIPILLFGGVCIFLILNIILGLLGILWYNINNRIPEIGLRQSVGASAGKIYQQFIGEMLVLTTLGFIPGILIAVQFPLLHAFEIEDEIYLLAILCSVFIIYMLVFISSFIPSIQAVKIQPAIALHEE
ncbi:ABC transporter permease [Maribellus maritimus]|uniref:ABC transporter permease n=1 Tax=Maribellus maritimus TaxID=2870838 RepID=UPI001EEADA93|nr:FtsX-like permease family protein [Maribellus maritimus]MCG6187898.1 ABC transporter permease [Maribellus maritimus]